MNSAQYWIDHFAVPDAAKLRRFLELKPSECPDLLETLGIVVDQPQSATDFESAENRVFAVDDSVVKIYRPGRWTREAIEAELEFLLDLESADVPFVRVHPGCREQPGEWQGLYFLVYKRVHPAQTRRVLSESDVREMTHVVARIHEVGAQRKAKGRPIFDPAAMGAGCFSVIKNAGYLPENLEERYQAAIDQLVAKIDEFGPVPIQRIHADPYSGNILWTESGPIFMDLDDFQMGPIAADLKLLSFSWRLDSLPEDMDRRERRSIQNKLVLDCYREVREFPEAQERLFPLLSAYRDIQFDAWYSARWSDPGFSEHYPDDDITVKNWWESSLSGLEELVK